MSTLRESFNDLQPSVDAASHDLLVRVVEELHPSDAASDMIEIAVASTKSGKRFRGLLAHLGAALAQEVPIGAATPPVDSLAAALELYQASALVHDDVIDHADTRRGRPTPHVSLARLHRESGWAGSATAFGVAGAILVGDLLFSAAERGVVDQCALLPNNRGHALSRRYAAMHAEVAMGQYLDVRAEQIPLDADDPTCVDVAASLKVITHKSARYSIVHPAALGALAAGASAEFITTLEQVLTPWGLAFQLRDDDLGVFGDPQATGKPAGDDLIEGKRTVLLALSWTNASLAERSVLARTIGRAEESAVGQAREVIASRGREAHEAMITRLVDEGDAVLTASTLPGPSKQILGELAAIITRRNA